MQAEAIDKHVSEVKDHLVPPDGLTIVVDRAGRLLRSTSFYLGIVVGCYCRYGVLYLIVGHTDDHSGRGNM